MVFGYVIFSFAVGLIIFALTWVAWLSMVALGVLLLIMAWPDAKSRIALLSITATLLFVQIWQITGMGEARWIAFAATWVALSALITSKCGKDHNITVMMCLASAITYFVGRMMGAEFSATSTGFPYLLAANIFAIIAILYAGWHGGISVRNMGDGGRVFGLAGGSMFSSGNSVGYLSGIKKKEAPQVKELS